MRPTTNPFTALFRSLEHDEYYLALDFLESFDREIQKAMRAQNISHSELAQRTGYSEVHLTRILGGQEDATISTLTHIASALGLRMQCRSANLTLEVFGK